MTTPVDRLAEALVAGGIASGPPLDDRDRTSLEADLGFAFPPDLAALLAVGVPRGDRFPDWHGDRVALAEHLAAPVHGLLFDVATNELWLPEWGDRPAEPEAARDHAARQLAGVPPLVPVYAHRYLPSVPTAAGNPVLSVVQSDIIVYGEDLSDYLSREFALVAPTRAPDAPAPRPVDEIPFWSRFVA